MADGRDGGVVVDSDDAIEGAGGKAEHVEHDDDTGNEAGVSVESQAADEGVRVVGGVVDRLDASAWAERSAPTAAAPTA